ncbi:hypothetical protein PCASD_16883 [Puccinia coronata f. sp. avenae]|uniref:Uncharacterized protein n=1 Tax=Puccinia coronata f. sp. avenae TaxID=200324 RepID=A0A2N5STI0_9BASI|nr:hypothetical protein PCASD_16883 [Puccinia coronata f. sp. avenae]
MVDINHQETIKKVYTSPLLAIKTAIKRFNTLLMTNNDIGHQDLISTSAVAAATATPQAPADNQWAHFWMAIGCPEFGGLGTVPRSTSNRTALGRPVVTVQEALHPSHHGVAEDNSKATIPLHNCWSGRFDIKAPVGRFLKASSGCYLTEAPTGRFMVAFNGRLCQVAPTGRLHGASNGSLHHKAPTGSSDSHCPTGASPRLHPADALKVSVGRFYHKVSSGQAGF